MDIPVGRCHVAMSAVNRSPSSKNMGRGSQYILNREPPVGLRLDDLGAAEQRWDQARSRARIFRKAANIQILSASRRRG